MKRFALRRQPARAQALVLAAKIRAILDGRYRRVRRPPPGGGAGLRHRILLNFEGEAEGIQPDSLIADILERVAAAAEPPRC